MAEADQERTLYFSVQLNRIEGGGVSVPVIKQSPHFLI